MPDAEQGEMPFLDHLEELRWRLIWSAGAIFLGAVAGFFLVTYLDVIGLLARPIQGLIPDDRLLYTSPTTPIMVTLKLSVVVGIILALPVIAYQGWKFVAPALYEHERKTVIPAIGVSFLLFLGGIAMAYFLVLPLGLRFLLGFQAEALSPIITIDEYLRFATRLILTFGLIFEMPVVMTALAFLGVLDGSELRTYRRHAILIMAAGAAFLTPADAGTMLMMLVPTWLLYELSIVLAEWTARRRFPGTANGE